MQQLLETIRDFARDNSMKLISAALFTLFGWMFGRWRATRSWKRREFFNRLNISLNTIHDGKLLIRTVLEKTCEDIFLNSAAVDQLLKAAQSQRQRTRSFQY